MRKHFTALFIASLVSGCATVKNGTTQEVAFQSNPAGVEIYEMTFSGEQLRGVTPTKLSLSKEIGKNFIFRKKGYKPEHFVLYGQVDSASYANVANLMIGDAVDTFTGAKYSFEKSEVFISLEPIDQQK